MTAKSFEMFQNHSGTWSRETETIKKSLEIQAKGSQGLLIYSLRNIDVQE